MEITLVVSVCIFLLFGPALSYDRSQFPDDYCKKRTAGMCCPDRDDDCTMPIYLGKHSSLCYCDEFCWQHRVEDCCPDYEPVCKGGPKNPPNECVYKKQRYDKGSVLTVECNEWRCVELKDSKGVVTVLYWQTENDACVNDEDLISNVNQGYYYGFRVRPYSRFNNMKLKDALRYFLGTNYPQDKVIRQHALIIRPDVIIPAYFDARQNFSGYIQAPMDQGRCAASWAFSTIGVASDRWAIQTKGVYRDLLSVQSVIACNRHMDNPCEGASVEAAWWLLQYYGAVSDKCYPYEYSNGATYKAMSCLSAEQVYCPNGQHADMHQTTPAYRISTDETHIKYEILTNGPVQAIIKVRADFFVYESGVYGYTGEPDRLTQHDHTLSGIHSVKILGWGEERGMKYWLAANSWGTIWGEDGYFKIKRGENESGIEEFVVGVWVKTETHDLHARQRLRHRN